MRKSLVTIETDLRNAFPCQTKSVSQSAQPHQIAKQASTDKLLYLIDNTQTTTLEAWLVDILAAAAVKRAMTTPSDLTIP